VQLLGILVGLLLAEAEQGVLVVADIGDWHVSESGCKPFKDLLLSLLNQKQLHVAADGIACSLIDSDQVAPFSCGVDIVIHDLTICKLGLLLEDFLRSSAVVDVGVVDVLLADDTELVLTDPSPESDGLVDFALFDFGFGIQIEDLDDSLRSLSSSQGDDVLRPVHEDAFSFHGLSFEGEVLRRVDDGTICLILDADVPLALKCDLAKLEELWVEPEVGELEYFFSVEWKLLLHDKWSV